MELFLAWLAEYAVELGGGAAALAIIETVIKPFQKLFGKTETVKLDDELKAALASNLPVETAALTVPKFIAIRRDMKADLEQELIAAQDTEKAELRARIAELETQIADPEPALAEAQTTIAELTDRLTRMGNDVSGDRLAEAQDAFARLDYSIADDIFAEVEERQKLEVQQAARAAFGRGEIAEAEIRWHDAAKHYARAARLDPSFDTLKKAREFAWRAGDAAQAFRWGEELIEIAKNDDGEENIAMALNEHAVSLYALGKYEEAEMLYRDALLIGEKTIGTEHPDYAAKLNELAHVVKEQGRNEEAEGLYREAFEIDKELIGSDYPSCVINLNNLARVIRAQGRYEEAEGLYRETLAIEEKMFGAKHPSYAAQLFFLSEAIKKQGRFEEAEGHTRDALAIIDSSRETKSSDLMPPTSTTL